MYLRSTERNQIKMFRHPSHIIITVLNSILPGNIRRPFFLAIHLIREISVDCDDVPIVDRFARYPYTMLEPCFLFSYC